MKTPKQLVVGERISIRFAECSDSEGTRRRNVQREGTIVELTCAEPRRGYVIIDFDGIGRRYIWRNHAEDGRVPDGRCKAHGTAGPRVARRHDEAGE